MERSPSESPIFVALDLPFEVSSAPEDRLAHAEHYPSDRHSALLDDVLGGADRIHTHVLNAQPRRAAVEPKVFNKTTQAAAPDVRSLVQPLQPFEISVASKMADPRANRDPIATCTPLFRGDVTPTNDLLLRVVRRRGADVPEVSIVGSVLRTVTFSSPADFLVLDPTLESRRKSHRGEDAAARRTAVPRPASFLSPLTPGLSGYGFSELASQKSATVRTLNVDFRSETVPSAMLPEAAAWLAVFTDARTRELMTDLLAAEPVWVMPELLRHMLKAGLRKPDANKSIVRAYTYRLLRGPLDRLIIRLGYDVRAPQNRDHVAVMQRVVVRTPRHKVRLHRSIAAMPDLQHAIDTARSEVVALGASTAGEFDLLARIFTEDCLLINVCVRDLMVIPSIGGLMQRLVLPEFNPTSGWYSPETIAQARLLLRDAVSDFAACLIPKLAVAPVGTDVEAPTVSIPRAGSITSDEAFRRGTSTLNDDGESSREWDDDDSSAEMEDRGAMMAMNSDDEGEWGDDNDWGVA